MIFLKRLKKLILEIVSETLLYKIAVSVILLFRFRHNYIHLTAKVRNTNLGRFTSIHKNAIVLNSQIGAVTYIGPDSFISYAEIGEKCSIAPGVVIGLATHRSTDGLVSAEPNIMRDLNNGEYGPLYAETKHFIFGSQKGKTSFSKQNDESLKVSIGNHVYIGQNTLISEGISIGNNVIIGCNSFVNHDVGEGCIVAGSPVRAIKND